MLIRQSVQKFSGGWIFPLASPRLAFMVRAFFNALRQISREVFQGDYRADTTPSGTVSPVSFSTSASLSQINDVFEADAAARSRQ